MAITVKLRYLRIAPRKVRLVADLIRGKSAAEAETLLRFVRKKAATPINKLLKSAIATAKNDFQLEKSNLYISKIMVGEGPTLKRYRFRAQGRIYSIMKRTSHITLVLDKIKEVEKVKKIKKIKKKSKIKEDKEKIKAVEEKPKKTKEKPKPEIKKEEKKAPQRKTWKLKRTLPRPEFKKAIKRVFRRKAF